ncbi:MAG: DUF262 domain-containing protein [Acidobacteria bacterium]|nr:DUF262 domain-containing protein [Acidobacteriota bacterium]
MIEYRVRSISLLNLVNDIHSGRLIPDAYFQRNLVWRDVHKRDFIKTILAGLPFPQFFISKGKVNVETMSTVSCIVDGQQRTDAIVSFIDGQLDVDGKKYVDLSEAQKSDFLKYEIAVIELDLENDDPKVQDIFQRINRTSNSLTFVEKLASQYSTSEFMLVAKLLSDHISLDRTDQDDIREDPNIPTEFFAWAMAKNTKNFVKLINEKGVFNSHEIARKTNLMHVLNIMSTIIGGFSNRNEKAIEHLDDYAQEFKAKDELIAQLERAAEFILKMGLRGKSYWLNKANIFSLIIAVVNAQKNGVNLNPQAVKLALEVFESSVPSDYKLAATEAVNNTRTRQLRNKYLEELLRSTVAA